MSDRIQVLDGWKELKEIVDGLEFDVTKNSVKGNAAAGVRVRKALRLLKKKTGELVKTMVGLDKLEKQEKVAAKAPTAE